MTSGKILQWTRRVVSIVILACITATIVGIPAVLTSFLVLNYDLQIVPALLASTLGPFIFWFIVTLLFGRVYCSSVCPVGTILDCLSRLLHRRRYRFTPSRLNIAITILIMTVVATMAGLMAVLDLLDPFSQYLHMVTAAISPSILTGSIAAITLAILVFMAWKGGRLYCNTICPLGGGLSIVARTSLFHIEIDPDRCTRCRRCVDTCKSECIEMDTTAVDTARCVTCFNCLAACPHNAIAYKSGRHQLSTPMFQRVGTKIQPTAIDDPVATQSCQEK